MKEIKINPLECLKHFFFLSSPIKYLLFEKITEKHFFLLILPGSQALDGKKKSSRPVPCYRNLIPATHVSNIGHFVLSSGHIK